MIDLHTHTTCSDGTDSPTELVRAAAEAGVTTLGITDHDTVAGWAEAEEAALAAGIALVRGVEMSARHAGTTLHILGYLLDPSRDAFAQHSQSLVEARASRLVAMIDNLAADGLVTHDEVAAHTPDGATPGRPHIADALVARGTYPDRSAAFADVLSNKSPYYIAYEAPSVARVVTTIHDCGGVAIWAHPMAAARWLPTEDDIREVISFGLDGLEIRHRDNADQALLSRIVAETDMMWTGSSDYHGTGKPNRLAENVTDPVQLARIVDRGSVEVIGV